MRDVRTPKGIAALQAAYFIPTAVFPFLSRRRFEAVTGQKREWWLVLTVSSLIGVIGLVLGLTARHEPDRHATTLLGAGSAAALGMIDVVYVARRRISPVYLIDGAIEWALVAGWLTATSAPTPQD